MYIKPIILKTKAAYFRFQNQVCSDITRYIRDTSNGLMDSIHCGIAQFLVGYVE